MEKPKSLLRPMQVIFPSKQYKYALIIVGTHLVSTFMLNFAISTKILRSAPVGEDGLPLPWIEEILKFNQIIAVLFFLFMTAIVFGIMISITSRFVGPMQRMLDQIRSYASGDFSPRIKLRKFDEVYELTEALNQLGDKLQDGKGKNSELRP